MPTLHSVKILGRFLLFTLAAVLGSNCTTAQTFTNLYNFTNTGVTVVNGNPVAGLVVSGNILYGATYVGGTNGNGMIFALNANGTGFATLYTFSPTVLDNSGAGFTNSDGANPVGLTLSGNMLYGTTSSGGPHGSGTVFGLSTNGSGFVTLHAFNRSSFDVNVLNSRTVMAHILKPVWYRPAARCMERQKPAASTGGARSLPSIPTARVLPRFIVLHPILTTL